MVASNLFGRLHDKSTLRKSASYLHNIDTLHEESKYSIVLIMI